MEGIGTNVKISRDKDTQVRVDGKPFIDGMVKQIEVLAVSAWPAARLSWMIARAKS